MKIPQLMLHKEFDEWTINPYFLQLSFHSYSFAARRLPCFLFYINITATTEEEREENYSFLCLINQLFTYYVCLKSWVQSKENTTNQKEKLFPFFLTFSFGVDFTFYKKKRFSLIFFIIEFPFVFFSSFSSSSLLHFFVKMWNGSLITYITSDYKQSRISAQQTFMEAMVQWSLPSRK